MKVTESKDKSEDKDQWFYIDCHSELIEAMEERIIALERALEALLRREEMAGQNAQTGGEGEWFG